MTKPRKTIVKAGINKLISEFGKIFGRKKAVGKKTNKAIKKVRLGKAGKQTKLRAVHGIARAKTKPLAKTKQRHIAKVAAGRAVEKVYKK